MSIGPFSPSRRHDTGCESATQLACKCRCRGAGHQFHLVERAVRCANATELHHLEIDLRKIFGGFHTGVRDVITNTRGCRWIPYTTEIATLPTDVRRGATWLETLLVDEALHAAFIHEADLSLASTVLERTLRLKFVENITLGAISVVGSPVQFSNVSESHVWCSVVAEFLDTLTQGHAGSGDYDKICYPRKRLAKHPSTLHSARNQGLQHLGNEYFASQLQATVKISILRLVGSATCPDLWQHPAAVRYCLEPRVNGPTWPPPQTTTLATQPQFGELKSRWAHRSNW